MNFTHTLFQTLLLAFFIFGMLPSGFAQRPKLLASGKTDICQGENVIFSLGGKYNWYNWNTGSKAPQTEVKGVQTGQIPVYCIVIDENGITQFSDTIIVNVFPRPNVPAVAYSSKEQLLEVSSVDRVQWYFKTIYSQDSLILGATSTLYRPTKAGYYFAEAVNDFGCTTRSKEIFVCFQPQLRVIGNTTFCVGNHAIIEIPVAYPQFLWSTGETEQAIVFRPKTPGVYSIYCTVSSVTCNVRSERITFRVLPVPDKPVVVVDSLNGLLRCKTKGVSYSWYRGQYVGRDSVRALNNDSIYYPREEGYYFVVVRNSVGCASTSQPVWIRSLPNGVEENNFLENKVAVLYPNPANEVCYLSVKAGNQGRVSVFALTGAEIGTWELQGGDQTLTLNTAHWSAGIYKVQWMGSDGMVSTQKLVIVK